MKLHKIAPDYQKNMIVANANSVAGDKFSRNFKTTKLLTPSVASLSKGATGLGASNKHQRSIGSILKETLGSARDNADYLGSEADYDQNSSMAKRRSPSLHRVLPQE